MEKQKKIKKLLLSEGAEAKIYLEKNKNKKIILKERIKKNYRHKKLDEKIVYSRTKKEYKILKKLEENTKNKTSLFFNKAIEYKKNKLKLQYIEGKELQKKDYENKKIIREIAKKIFLMHKNKIIHGDITPKNILKTKEEKIYFIDFGLSYFSERIEDKVYDLYMTKETFSQKFYKKLLEEYKTLYKKENEEKKFLLLEERIKRIEERGKNKKKNKKE